MAPRFRDFPYSAVRPQQVFQEFRSSGVQEFRSSGVQEFNGGRTTKWQEKTGFPMDMASASALDSGLLNSLNS